MIRPSALRVPLVGTRHSYLFTRETMNLPTHRGVRIG